MKEVYYCTQRRLSGNSAAILFCTQASIRRELSGRAGRGAGVRGRREDGRSVPLHLGLSSKWAYSTKTRAHQIWWAPYRDTEWHQQGPGDTNWGLEMMGFQEKTFRLQNSSVINWQYIYHMFLILSMFLLIRRSLDPTFLTFCGIFVCGLLQLINR